MRVEVIRPLGTIDGGEDGLQVVVVLLSKRVELVVVALRTLDRQRAKCVERITHDLIAVGVPSDLAIDLGFGDFDVPDEIPRTGREEAQSQNAVAGAGEEHVTSDLFLREAGIGFVFIERSNDVVAIGPSIHPQLVFVIAAGVRVLDDVEPMPRPAFAVVLRIQQSIDEFFVSRAYRRCVFRLRFPHERLDFLRRRRQTDQVEVQPPNQRARLSRRRRNQLLIEQRLRDEAIDRIRTLRFEIGN